MLLIYGNDDAAFSNRWIDEEFRYDLVINALVWDRNVMWCTGSFLFLKLRIRTVRGNSNGQFLSNTCKLVHVIRIKLWLSYSSVSLIWITNGYGEYDNENTVFDIFRVILLYVSWQHHAFFLSNNPTEVFSITQSDAIIFS